MTIEIKQSTTTYPLVFLMVDSTDHVTGKTGLTPTVTLSKAGAAFGAAAGAVTEIANGWYKVAGNATDNNTLGPLILHATGAAADPTDVLFNVTARLADDLAYPATSGRSMVVDANGLVDANTVKVGPTGAGTAQTARDIGASVLLSSGTGTGQLDFTSGVVKADIETIKTQAVTAAAGVTFPTSIASPTNITAGTITTVTNLTNAPTSGDLTAAMKASVNAEVDAALADVGVTTTVTGRIDAAISTRASQTSVDAIPTAGAIADAVWDEATSGHVGAGSTGLALRDADLRGSRTVVRATATTGASTTSIPTSAFSPAGGAADQFKGRIVVFDNDTSTAALRGQATDITASSNSATPTLTVTALTTAPSSGDTFSVL